jgi:hypothetical protein
MITRRKVPIYVCSASRELSRVLPLVERLESTGLVEITHRWFDAVQAHGVGNDDQLPAWKQREHATSDLKGVTDASIVWCLLPNCQSLGAPFELGYALAMVGSSNIESPQHIVVTGPATRGFIFASLVWRHESDDAGFSYVIDTAREIQDGMSGPVGSVP